MDSVLVKNWIIFIKTKNMNRTGPIIIIEDDKGDQELLNIAFEELDIMNEIIFFQDPEIALDFLMTSTEEPFIILSDLNMPKLSGIELREKIDTNEDLRLKCIPYLFFSTSAEQKYVVDAYSKSVQGFFIKPNTVDALTKILATIVQYWQQCESPNFVK